VEAELVIPAVVGETAVPKAEQADHILVTVAAQVEEAGIQVSVRHTVVQLVRFTCPMPFMVVEQAEAEVELVAIVAQVALARA